jgi:hypothetical protein
MKEITGIKENANQSLNFVLEDGNTFTIDLQFRSNVNAWYYTITSDVFTIRNKRLVNSPNVLFQYKNILKFGISVISNDGQDPAFITDFSTGRIRLFVIENTEKDEIISEYFG